MKKIFIIIFLLNSFVAMACQKHLIDFKVENKSIYKTDDYHITSFEKNSENKWQIGFKIPKKGAAKIISETKKNIGKNLNFLFDQRPVATSTIAAAVLMPQNSITISTIFDDKEIEMLKAECQHDHL